MERHDVRWRTAAVALVLSAIALVATSAPTAARTEGDRRDHHRGREPQASVLFSGEGNNLNAYATESPFVKQNVIRNAGDDPEGL
ncbi:MAG: hypothetical protein K0R11_2215, partial [Acidimicrobiales bacterium]|nr:hypothetical protein [Acidimicrobiales bacterium]